MCWHCPLPSVLLEPAHLGVQQLFLPSLLTVCISRVANQAYENSLWPSFPSHPPESITHSTIGQRGAVPLEGSWSVEKVGVWGVRGRVLRWNYPILWFLEPVGRVNDGLNGFLLLLLSSHYGWSWGFHCCAMSKCTSTMRTSKFRVYLSRLNWNLSVFHVQWAVLAL